MSREYDSGQRHRDLNEIGEAKIEKGQFKSGEQSLGLNGKYDIHDMLKKVPSEMKSVFLYCVFLYKGPASDYPHLCMFLQKSLFKGR